MVTNDPISTSMEGLRRVLAAFLATTGDDPVSVTLGQHDEFRNADERVRLAWLHARIPTTEFPSPVQHGETWNTIGFTCLPWEPVPGAWLVGVSDPKQRPDDGAMVGNIHREKYEHWLENTFAAARTASEVLQGAGLIVRLAPDNSRALNEHGSIFEIIESLKSVFVGVRLCSAHLPELIPILDEELDDFLRLDRLLAIAAKELELKPPQANMKLTRFESFSNLSIEQHSSYPFPECLVPYIAWERIIVGRQTPYGGISPPRIDGPAWFARVRPWLQTLDDIHRHAHAVASMRVATCHWIERGPDTRGAGQDNSTEATHEKKPPKKYKRSTERGEGREKLISALITHHGYSNGSCLNWLPIGSNALARLAGVSKSTAQAFFKKEFHSHGKYRAMCSCEKTLVAALRLLNGEFAPGRLFNP